MSAEREAANARASDAAAALAAAEQLFEAQAALEAREEELEAAKEGRAALAAQVGRKGRGAEEEMAWAVQADGLPAG